MNTPYPIQPQEKIDLKLGIKSSLPKVKSTIALFILIWEATNRPSNCVYGKQDGDAISATDMLINKLLVFTNKVRKENNITSEIFRDNVNANQLFKSQLEALIVAFELIWKLGKITFQGGMPSSTERTGGKRYPKKIEFSANMDIIHYSVAGETDKLSKTLLAWMNLPIEADDKTEQSLLHILCVFAEEAIFRLEYDSVGSLIFNQLGIYKAALANAENVNISGEKEAKGALRILKSYLNESLNPFLTYSKEHDVFITGEKKELLQFYADRVSTLASLKATETVTPDIVPDESCEDNSISLTDNNIDEKFNRIFIGAPGTGKSHQLNEEAKSIFPSENIERVTFYPTYSYQQFVGTYKPAMVKPNDSGKEEIAYKYIPGPFIRSLIKSLKNPNEKFLLIVEELNRANAPAVFGDIFQLMDRLPNGRSTYDISASEDLKNYLLENEYENDKIYLPPNLYIWATMNSADQGVYPLDTAFKRRWSPEYIGIDTNENVISRYYFKLATGIFNWNELRKAINKKLTSKRVNEDKLLGPFFINPEQFTDEKFSSEFKDKVLMYLFDDAAHQCRRDFFNEQYPTFSSLCDAFDLSGPKEIFKDIEITPLSDESILQEVNQQLDGFLEYLNRISSLNGVTPNTYFNTVNRMLVQIVGKGYSMQDFYDNEKLDKIRHLADSFYTNRNSSNQAKKAFDYYLKFKGIIQE